MESNVPATTGNPVRMPGLDAARALATLAMVVGHTADGLLLDPARGLPWVQTYWTYRGLTAPLFLFVAGWAVVASVSRGGKTGMALVRERAGRVALLFAVGTALRWPGWNVPGVFSFDREVWRHLTGFDALHAVGASLLLGIIVLSCARTPSTRAFALTALAAFFPLASAAVWAWANEAEVTLALRSVLVADVESPFPIFPWAGYFFSGAATGQLLSLVPQQGRKALALVSVGTLAVLLCRWIGTGDLAQTSPVLFLSRLGHVWMIAGAATALPLAAAVRLAPLGRSSLVVYAAHLPIVYGWSTIPGLSARYGHVLTPTEVIAVAGGLLTGGLALAALLRSVRRVFPWRQPVAGTAVELETPKATP